MLHSILLEDGTGQMDARMRQDKCLAAMSVFSVRKNIATFLPSFAPLDISLALPPSSSAASPSPPRALFACSHAALFGGNQAVGVVGGGGQCSWVDQPAASSWEEKDLICSLEKVEGRICLEGWKAGDSGELEAGKDIWRWWAGKVETGTPSPTFLWPDPSSSFLLCQGRKASFHHCATPLPHTPPHSLPPSLPLLLFGFSNSILIEK